MLCATIITARTGDYYNYFLSIMARFLDEEEHREYIDITSTSEDQDAPQAGAVGGSGLPTPPHQPPMEVSTTQLLKHGALVVVPSFFDARALLQLLLVGSDRPQHR